MTKSIKAPRGAARQIKRGLWAVLLLAHAGTALAGRDWGQIDFDCQVRTANNEYGLVMIQAENLESAEKAAQGGTAKTVSGGSATATEVIQCVQKGKKRFANLEFRRFAESLPR